LSKTEDYLDSLLSAVSDGSAGRVVRKDSKNNQKDNQKESRYNRRKAAYSDKRFIDEFENELMIEDAEDADEFLKAFEMELDESIVDEPIDEPVVEHAEESVEDFDEEVPAELNAEVQEAETAEQIEEAAEHIDEIAEQIEETAEQEFDTDSLLSEAMSILGDPEPVQEETPEVPEMESEDEAPLLMDESEDLMNILDNGASDDDEISDIGDLLKALGSDEIIEQDLDLENEEGAEPSILNQLEAISAEETSTGESHSAGGIDDFDDDVVEVTADADAVEETDKKSKKKAKKDKKEKAKKEKKEGGFFSKLATILFGDDDEDQVRGEAINEGLENLSEENMAIIADLEADAAQSTKEAKGKKGKKEKKVKEKKPKKEKPKKEKKPKAPKPEKPKKKINPEDLDLTPPLPKAPVILIFIMVISFIALTILATNLLDKSNMVSNAKADAKTGNYVGAYSNYTGKDLSEKDEEQKAKYELLASVQAEYDDYVNLMYIGKYDMAIDALVCAVGRYGVNYEDAVNNEIAVEYGNLHEKILAELDKLGISEEDAAAIYELKDRKEYTKAIYDLVQSLGYEVD